MEKALISMEVRSLGRTDGKQGMEVGIDFQMVPGLGSD